MHCDIVVLKLDPDIPCDMTDNDVFEKMHDSADYVTGSTLLENTKDIVNYLQELMYIYKIAGKVSVVDNDKVKLVIDDPQKERRDYIFNKFVRIEEAMNESLKDIDDSLSYYRVKAATYDDNDIWICTDLFSCIGSFEVMPLDLFMDYLKYLEHNSETKGKGVILYFDKLYDYHF